MFSVFKSSCKLDSAMYGDLREDKFNCLQEKKEYQLLLSSDPGLSACLQQIKEKINIFPFLELGYHISYFIIIIFQLRHGEFRALFQMMIKIICQNLHF